MLPYDTEELISIAKVLDLSLVQLLKGRREVKVRDLNDRFRKNLQVFTPNPTSHSINLCHLKTKSFEQIEREWISKFTVGIFEIPKDAAATAFQKP